VGGAAVGPILGRKHVDGLRQAQVGVDAPRERRHVCRAGGRKS
jgi:hypothetical protein